MNEANEIQYLSLGVRTNDRSYPKNNEERFGSLESLAKKQRFAFFLLSPILAIPLTDNFEIANNRP